MRVRQKWQYLGNLRESFSRRVWPKCHTSCGGTCYDHGNGPAAAAVERARDGARSNTMGINGIMKKILFASVALAALTAGSASAADLPIRQAPAAAPVYAPIIFSWTGFYIGANVGGVWNQTSVTDTAALIGASTGNNNGAFMGGGQVGANYQMGSFVLGVEGDFDWAAKNNNAATVGALTVTSNNTWISTAAARFGFAYDRVLFYGKAGGGWIGNNGFTVTNTATGASFSGTNNNTASGWLVGAGIEWAFAYNWSVKLEYDYLGLSSQSFATPAGFVPVDTFTTGNNNVQMVKLGVNYRFGWDAPVAARY
jgi:outer membrane immunogenic protein